MITQLNTIAHIWWQWMSGMFWQVGLLILLVTLIDMAIRRWAWPQVRYVLWGLVFLKLIIPPTWQMPTSIVSWVQPMIEKQFSVRIETSDEIAGMLLPSEAVMNSEGFEESTVAGEQATWQTFVFTAWFGGIVVFMLILIRKMSRLNNWQRLQQELNNADPEIPGWFHTLLSETAKRLKLKKSPVVVLSKDAVTPAVYGVFHPVLLLPGGYLKTLPREQAEHVLIHELCHLKRGDLWVHWFCLLIQMVYWFNPLLIWSRRQMRHVCEICCDLSVADILREKTRSYRETLLKNARELFTETVEPSLGLLGLFEEPFRIVSRLRWLEKETWGHRKKKITATLVTSLIMAICVMPMAGLSQSAEQRDEDGVYELWEVDEEPSRIYAPPLVYPPEAKKDNIRGRVVVEFIVTRDGTLKDEWIIESEPPDVFDDSAMEAIRQFIFEPGYKNGEPVDVRVRTPITFIPENNDSVDTWYQLSEVDQPPRVLRAFPPPYPASAKRDNIEGRVVLRFVVDTDGKAKNLEVALAVPENVFEEAAKEAVNQYEFNPAILNGETVACMVKMPIEFRLGIPDMPKSVPDGDTKIFFDFNNMDIQRFITAVGKITGKNYIVDDDVTGKVTVQSSPEITIEELHEIFQSVLDMAGYVAIESGDAIRIIKK